MNLEAIQEAAAAHREHLREHLHNPRIGPVVGEDAIHEQLIEVEKSLEAGTLTVEAWEQHQLDWLAYIGEFSRANFRLSAHAMLAFEYEQRTNPATLAKHPEVLKLLHWWLEEGGKEEYLGQLPIEDRRNLEERARNWPKDYP